MERVLVSKRVVLVNSVSTYVARALSLTVFFWVQQYILRRMPPPELEAMFIVQNLLLFVPLISLVVVSGLARYVTESFAQADDERVTQIVSSMFPLCLVVALLMGGVGALLTWKLNWVLTVKPEYLFDARVMFTILVGMISLRVAALPFGVGVHVRQKFLQANLIGIAAECIRIGTVFALLFGVSTRALWLIVAQVPSALFDVFVGVVYSKHLLPAVKFRPSQFRWEMARPILSFGGWTFLGRVVAVMRETVGNLSLNHFSTSADVVTYRSGALVESRIWPTILAPLVTAQTAVTTMHATGQEERLRRYLLKMSRYIAWCFFICAFPLVIFRHEVWTLYMGPETLAKYPYTPLVMTLLALKALVTFPQPLVAQVALAKAEQRAAQVRVMILEGLGIVATLWLVIHLHGGAVGAAVGTMVVTMALAPILHWDFGIRMVKSSWGEFFRATLVPSFLPALLATPVWFVLHRSMPTDTWLGLGASFGAGALVYAAGVWAMLRPEEKNDAMRVFRRLAAIASGARRANA